MKPQLKFVNMDKRFFEVITQIRQQKKLFQCIPEFCSSALPRWE